jgi:hypothetical protein
LFSCRARRKVFWKGPETGEGQVSGHSASVDDTGLVILDRAICLGLTTKVAFPENDQMRADLAEIAALNKPE